MKLTINLASKEYLLLKKIKIILYCLSILSLLLFITNIFNLSSYREKEVMIRESSVRVKEREKILVSDLKKRGIDISKKGVNRLKRDVSFANELIEKKRFSWSLFFNDIEEDVSSNISIKAIKPSSQQSSIVINGAALSLKSLTNFIKDLEDSDRFNEVFLTNQKKGKDNLLDFTIKLKYQREQDKNIGS
ncbi:MAG: PilN domain-containing protein [Nitrospirota bacterium]